MAHVLDLGEQKPPKKEGLIKTLWAAFKSLDKFTKIFIIIVILVALATPFIVNNLQNFWPQAARNEQIAREKQEISEKARNLIGLARKLNKASEIEKPSIVNQVKNLATERNNSLKQAMETDPYIVLENSIPQELKAQMPQEIQGLIEENVELKGNLELIHEDYFDQEKSQNKYIFSEEGTNKKYEVKFADGKVPLLTTGNITRVKGVKIEDKIATVQENTENLVKGATYPTYNNRKLLVILLYFQDSTTTEKSEISVASERGYYYTNSNSVKNYWLQASYNQTKVEGVKNITDGDIIGPYTISYSKSTCDPKTWRLAALEKIKAAGYDPNQYQLISMVFPRIWSCSWGGLGSFGGSIGYQWISGNAAGTVGVRAHEIGHSLGFGHASSWSCVENGTRITISSNDANCAIAEYGDLYDIMGSSPGYKHVSNYNKGTANWLVPTNTITVDRNTSLSQTFNIVPQEKMQTNGIISLRVPRIVSSTGVASEYYYIEHRTPYGFDNFSATDYPITGVTIRIAPNYGSWSKTKLIDTTSSTTSFSDAPLAVGKTFNDLTYGIKITTLSTSSTGASVRIDFDPSTLCKRANPTLSITPTTQSDISGSALGYKYTIKNNDSVECGTSTFDFNATLPSSWSKIPSTILSETLSPGSEITKEVTIVSLASVTSGNYMISLKATNKANTNYTTSASAIYNVTVSSYCTSTACANIGGTCMTTSACSSNTRWNGNTCVKEGGTNGNGYCCVPIDSLCNGTYDCKNSNCQTVSPFGTCQTDSKTCYGGYVSGRCPGPTNFRCCLRITCPVVTTITNTPTPLPTATNTPTLKPSNTPTLALKADSTPPVVNIISPKNNTVITDGNFTILSLATDESGISKIQIILDDKVIKTCLDVTGCSIKVNGSKLTAGTHIAKAIATDKSITPNTGSYSINLIK